MRLLAIFALALSVAACASEGADSWPELDLTAYNVPIVIHAPDSARVAARTLSGLMDDVTVKSPADEYSIQVLASRATTNDMSRLKAEQLELVRNNRFFERIVEEEPAGFIFENRIDTTSIYGFRYIIYQGDREFVFQNSFDGTFDLEQIRQMYASVKPRS